MRESRLNVDHVLDKRSGDPGSGDEPRAERIPAELAPGSVLRRGELDAAAVDSVKGVPSAGVVDGGWTASELAPVHYHADICGAAFICEGQRVGEDAEEQRDEDTEGEVVERLKGYYLSRVINK